MEPLDRFEAIRVLRDARDQEIRRQTRKGVLEAVANGIYQGVAKGQSTNVAVDAALIGLADTLKAQAAAS